MMNTRAIKVKRGFPGGWGLPRMLDAANNSPQSQKDTVDAMVLGVDPTARRISLGLKQVETNPWHDLAEKYPVGSRIQGKVRNLTEFGAFVEVEDGIDGLIHISDMSWSKVKHPSEVLKKGDTVEAQVLNLLVDLKESLGLTYIFVSHDLNVVRFISDRVMVMYLGEVAEIGTVEALYADPADARSLHDWGRLLGASERTLARRFETELGMSLREWRHHLRVFLAVEWLGAGRSVTEVALALGYASTAAFSYMFRRAMGCAPTEWLARLPR